MGKVFHSVYLDKDKCLGCTNCLRSCPTGAIRIRNGKARIIETKCIDCGECIRVCPHYAKKAKTDSLDVIADYAYKVAIPAPSLLGQFKQKNSIARILSALKDQGFDEIVEVATGAELVGQAIRLEIEKDDYPKPMISSACPAVAKLIQIRFPELTENINRLTAPMGLTARLTRKRLAEEKGLKNEEIGIFFITPCAAKATEVKNENPDEDEFSVINGAISFKDIYSSMIASMKKVNVDESIHNSTAEGFSWAVSGGESKYIPDKRVMHVDGIASVIRILDEIDCEKLDDIDFFEGLACIGGCVGGCLAVENNFVAKMNLEERARDEKQNVDHKIDASYVKALYDSGIMHNSVKYEPRKLKPLDENVGKAIQKMKEIEALEARLPGLDCGSCGAPGCRALAEDIVMGNANEMDCVFVLKDRVLELSRLTSEMLEVVHPTGKYNNQTEDEDES